MISQLREKWGETNSSTRYVLLVGAVLVAVLVVVVTVVGARAASKEDVVYDPIWDNPRIPKTVTPSNYNIVLNIDVTKSLFWGTETIKFDITNITSVILVHVQELNISDVSVYYRDNKDKDNASENRKQLGIVHHHSWKNNSYYVIKLKQYMKVEDERTYELDISWRGTLKTQLKGLYISKYTGPDNEIRHAIASQMQPTSARYAFPCFDEPEFKATFDMTIRTEANYSLVLWNTDSTSDEDIKHEGRDWKSYKFETSPTMSTYLLAFVVANFDCSVDYVTSVLDGKNITVRVCGRPGPVQAGDGAYALQTTKDVVTFFEEYYNQPYPLSKIVNVGVPDFEAGAMENWGLIIYREELLFYNEEVDTISVKGSVNLVVSHELAHMWFGNLVTMKWWKDIWLNEGFATYAQGLGTTHVEDTWNNEKFLIGQHRSVAMNRDAYTTSRPASVEVTDPDHVQNLFDEIAYQKGASLLNQLNMVMSGTSGDNNINNVTNPFQEGVKSYLKAFKYSNADQTQLYSELNKWFDSKSEENLSVKQIMDTWTLQMNFPVVSVTKYDDDNLLVSQKRLVMADENDVDKEVAPYGYQWYVPIKYLLLAADNTIKKDSALFWIKPHSQVTVALPTDNTIFLNTNGDGYYATYYDLELWNSLIGNLDKLNLNVREKQVLLYDTALLVKAGYYPISRQLKLLDLFKADEEFNVAEDVYTQIGEISALIRNLDDDIVTKWRNKWATSAKELYDRSKAASSDGDDNDDDGYVKKLALSSSTGICLAFNKDYAETKADCITDVEAKWNTYISTDELPASDYLRAVLSYAVANDTEDAANWKKIQSLYLDKSTSAATKKTLAYALAQTTNSTTLHTYIEMCRNPDMIRRSDGLYILGRTIAPANKVATNITLQLLIDDWLNIYKEFATADLALPSYIKATVSQITTDKELTEVEKAFKDERYLKSSIKSAYEGGIEKAKGNIAWIAKNKEAITDFVQSNDS